MSKDNDKVLPGTYLAIEVYGPGGLQWQPCDSIGQLREEAERAKRFGYELTAARAGGIGAFTPKVEPDELRQDIPGTFDLPDILPVTDAYNLARRHGLSDIHCTADGVAGRQRDAAGNTWRVQISSDQREAG